MEFAGGASGATSIPCRRQPQANRYAINVRLKVYAFIFTHARGSVAVDASIAPFSRRKIDIVNREQRVRNEKMRMPEIKIRNQRHLQCAAPCDVLEVGSVRRDE